MTILLVSWLLCKNCGFLLLTYYLAIPDSLYTHFDVKECYFFKYFCLFTYLYLDGKSIGLPKTPSVVGLNCNCPSLTACSTGSSVCKMFFLINSKGPGLSKS